MRLNSAMRAQIINKAIAAKFDPIEAKLKKEELAIGHAFWTHLFGRAKEHIAKLPRNWVYQVPSEVKGVGVECAFTLLKGFNVRLLVPETDLLPAHIGWHVLGVIKDEALCARWEAFSDAEKQLEKDREEASATLKALLASVGTYSSLEREWPAGKKFYASLPGDFPGMTGLPMVQVKKLNAMLGIGGD